MDDRKLEIIQQLMEELQEEMSYSEGDLGGRLGREPRVEVAMEVEGEEPGMDDEFAMEGDPEDPEMKFKDRLMKLRG